jgi:hypothetical protein
VSKQERAKEFEMAKYTEGQRVETLEVDFDTPGFPEVWMPGTVDRIEPIGDKGLTQAFVQRNKGGWSPQIIGKRGGNRRIRSAE